MEEKKEEQQMGNTFPPFIDWMKINYPIEFTAFIDDTSHQSYFGPTNYEMATYGIRYAYNYPGRFELEYRKEKSEFDKTHSHVAPVIVPPLEVIDEDKELKIEEHHAKKRKLSEITN